MHYARQYRVFFPRGAIHLCIEVLHGFAGMPKLRRYWTKSCFTGTRFCFEYPDFTLQKYVFCCCIFWCRCSEVVDLTWMNKVWSWIITDTQEVVIYLFIYIYILICLFPSNNQEETCQTAPEVELEKSRMSNTPHRSWVFRRLSRFVLFRYLHDRLNGIYESYVYPQLIRMCIITRWISSICLIYMGAGDDGKLSALFTSQHV